MPRSWDEDDEHRIGAMLAGKMSFEAIGQKEGLSRSAIAGRIWRNPTLARLVTRTQAENGRSNGTRTVAKPTTPPKPKAAPPPPTVAAPPPPPPPPPPLGPMRRVPLMALCAHECRYPIAEKAHVVGRQLFCGRRIEPGALYCREHAEIMFQRREAG